jgi:hypothetical protein
MHWIELVSNLATVVAAGTAVWGIRAWRDEHVGRRRIDLAEEVLAIVYEARDVLEAVRSPLGHADEGETRQGSDEEIDTETAMLNQAFVQVERCNRRQDLFAQLRSLRYRFMAQHGGDSRKLFEELEAIRRSLRKPFYSLQTRIRALRQKCKGMEKTQYDEELNKLWEAWQEEQDSHFDEHGNDLVLEKADAIVQRFEETCRQAIGVQK